MGVIRTVQGRPSVLRETTGERLQRLRLAKGLTQLGLGGAAGLSQPVVSYIERDEHSPQIWVLAALARALDTCICYLYAGGAGCEHDGEAAS